MRSEGYLISHVGANCEMSFRKQHESLESSLIITQEEVISLVLHLVQAFHLTVSGQAFLLLGNYHLRQSVCENISRLIDINCTHKVDLQPTAQAFGTENYPALESTQALLVHRRRR